VSEAWERLKARARRGALHREAHLRALGLEDPKPRYQWAATWALVRNEIAPRCIMAILEGRLDDAAQLARRWQRADERAKSAQHEAQQREAAIVAYRKSLRSEGS